jgi:hypothetical protein
MRFVDIYICGRRKDQPWIPSFISGVVALFTRSDWIHCCIAYEGIVYNATSLGPQYLMQCMFDLHYPAPLLKYRVPINEPLDLHLPCFAEARGLRWASVWNWLRKGEGRCEDCVSTTLVALLLGGVEAPHTITTAEQLRCWLEAKGYEHASLAT